MQTNLITLIESEMASDDANRNPQSLQLIRAFETSEDRHSINMVMIALCGWSLDTLLERCGGCHDSER
ncbi:MAG: hypothetical protein P1V20_28700 [Verrucomicrobiales bacterium]|nr:hypothetical protein [Verrucomicrobiales bacterium]